MRGALAAALLALAAPARAEPALELPDQPVARSAPGWSKQGRSLLLYDRSGELSVEIGLTPGEEYAGRTREILGGTSPEGRAAWTLERRLLWTPQHTKLLESRRTFKMYGQEGKELWSDDAADLPERGDPVAFSADGRVLLLARREGEAWAVVARDWLGAPLLRAGPFPRLLGMTLTPNGRFAMVRWAVPDKSATHTFLDLKANARKDLESSSLTLGLARIDDEGTARSGSRVVFSFAADASTAAPSGVSVSTPPAAGPRE